MSRPPPSTLRVLSPLLGLSCAFGLLSAGCGAQNVDAPPAKARPAQCQSLSRLAPAFMDVLRSGEAEKLRTIIERNDLLADQPDGSASPVMTVLKVVVGTVNQFADDPPEANAPPGQLCAEEEAFAPAPADANRMCEVRRLIKTFVRDGKGLEAIRLLDPFIAGLLKYSIGQAPVATEPHWELAGVTSRICSRADCRTEDVLDVVAGLLDFISPTAAEPDRPKKLLALLNALVNHPSMNAVYGATSTMPLEDMLAFSNLLMDQMAALPTDPARFDIAYHRDIEILVNDLLTTLKIHGSNPEHPEYADLRALVSQVIGPHEKNDKDQPHGTGRPLLYDMLDPRRSTPILQPMQKLLQCAQKSDPGDEMMKMVYELGLSGDVLGLRDIVRTVDEITALDERGTILNFAKVLLTALRRNEHGLASVRKLCAVAFDIRPPEDGGLSNAELAAPVLAKLFEDGGIGEILCVVDTLLYGCSGGQPACQQQSVPPP